jgi:hypothetical protein
MHSHRERKIKRESFGHYFNTFIGISIFVFSIECHQYQCKWYGLVILLISNWEGRDCPQYSNVYRMVGLYCSCPMGREGNVPSSNVNVVVGYIAIFQWEGEGMSLVVM